MDRLAHIYPELASPTKKHTTPDWPLKCPCCGASRRRKSKDRYHGHVYRCGGRYTLKPQIQNHTDYWWGSCPVHAEQVRLLYGKPCEECKELRLEGTGFPEGEFGWDCKACGHRHLSRHQLLAQKREQEAEQKRQQDAEDLRSANARLAELAQRINNEQRKKGSIMAIKKITKKTVAKKVVAKKENESKGRTPGLTMGLGIQATWVKVFANNAKAKKTDRLSDEQITSFMQKEFPAHKDSKVFTMVQAVRNKYNKGGFNNGEAPSAQSERYSEDGEVTTARGKAVTEKNASAKKSGSAVVKKTPVKKVVKKVIKKKA